MVQPSKILPFAFCGRRFLSTEIESIRNVVSDFRALSLTEIARTICEILDWKRPNGRLKNHECRLLLEKLSAAGLVNLPPLRESGPRGPRVVMPTENGEEQEPFSGSLRELGPLTLTVVRSRPESALWNELVARYHYLGYKVPVGANLRYLVRSVSTHQVLACLSWSSPAWKMAARDSWIGWTNEERARNLQSIVNNSRFLILPWVRVRNMASTILSLCARHLPADWEHLFGYRPAAFGDADRYSVSRHQLSSGELDLSGRNTRARSDGPASRGSRALGEADLRLFSLSRCAVPTRKKPRAALDPEGRAVMGIPLF